MGISSRVSVETRGKKKKRKKKENMELVRDGESAVRDYDRRDSTTRERETERGHRLLFETDLHKNLLPVFRVQDSLYFVFSTHLLLPFLPHDAKEGQREKKKKRKRKPAERILPISPSINAVYT